mgnify:CR=1 FL=1
MLCTGGKGMTESFTGDQSALKQLALLNRIALLAATLTREELLTLPADQVLRRLFWEEPLRRFEPLSPRFACTCSRERVSGMLQSLGRDESDGLIAERGTHQMLLLRDGLYAQMWARQREASEAEERAREAANDAQGFVKRGLPAAE